MKEKHRWTPGEELFILLNASMLTDKQAAKELSVAIGSHISESMYARKRQNMGIVKKMGRGKCEVIKVKPRA